MAELSNPIVIKELLRRHGFHFSKSLGQNFIINPDVCPQMAQLSGAGKGVGVLEIGPGFGVLTKELARIAEKVVAIEIDERLPAILHETLSEYDNVDIILGDCMEMNLSNLIQEKFQDLSVIICANLPYYITSPILMKLLESNLPVESITVMVQKEAANRITAKPGTRDCGSISAAVWYYSVPNILFDVPRDSFMPAPDVDSAVIKLNLRHDPPLNLVCVSDYFKIVKASFCQRRKTILNSLSSGLGLSKDTVMQLLSDACIPANTRAEQLSLEQLGTLSNLYSKM